MDASTLHSTIAQEFGISTDTDAEYIDQIAELVLQGVLIKSLTVLSESQAAQLEQLDEEGAEPSAVLQFLQSTVPNFSQIIHDEIQNVKTDLATE